MQACLARRAAWFAVVLPLAACTTMSPYEFSPCVRGGGATDECRAESDLEARWQQAEADTRDARARYVRRLEELGSVTPTVGRLMLALGTFGLLRGINASGSGDIPRAAVLGTAAYGYGALAASPPREQVYIAGIEALSCALAAAEPLGRAIPQLGESVADADSLRGRRARAGIELGELMATVRELGPWLQPVVLDASVPAQCRAPAPSCVPAQQPDALSREACAGALAEWQQRCRGAGAKTLVLASLRAQAVHEAAQAEQEAIAATLKVADETIRRVESAPHSLLARSATIQAAVAKEVQKTAPDLNAVASVVALVKREGTPTAPSAPRPTSDSDAESSPMKRQRLDATAEAALDRAEHRLQQARDARLRLAVVLDDIAARTAGAEDGLGHCSLSVPGVTLDVVPADTALNVKAGGKLMFDVGGGTGVPTASAMFGSVSGRLVEGQLRFEYQAPAQAPDGPDTITFRDGARQARHVVKVTVK